VIPRWRLFTKYAAFIIALVSAALVVVEVRAADVVRIGFLAPDEEPRYSQLLAGLRQGLRDLGHRDNELIVHEQRVPRGDNARAASGARTLQREQVRVTFVVGTELGRVVRKEAPELPIVFITPGDPVGVGLVASLARPGGNVTGMTFEHPELTAKRIELMRELAPQVRRIVVLYDRRDASPRQGFAAARDAAPRFGLTLVELAVEDVQSNPKAIGLRGKFDGLLVIPGGAVSTVSARVIEHAQRERAVSVASDRAAATQNVLLSYGASDVDVAREAARLVDRIAKGQRAAELPVERPVRLRLSVNARVARAVGITIPQSVLVRADEVIE